MIKRILLLTFLIGAFGANAQNVAEDHLSGWYIYTGTNRVSDRWSVHSEVQLHYYQTLDNFKLLLLRTGLNYHIRPDAIATLGYAHLDVDPMDGDISGEEGVKENRIYEQFVLKNTLWEFHIAHRYRLEQRFFDYGDATDTRYRARYRIRLDLPLTDVFFLSFYDELMVNLQDDLFNQNRLYAGFGVNLTSNSNVKLGYMRNQHAHAVYDRLLVVISYNPDLRNLFSKKKSLKTAAI